ncbi:hypothetical protein Ae707Ps1_6198c [Pseudonocardia sp. Ae707_Ps1]|nr:hypothetical protein Ae707Ps1_6198c [Pseudonocardia sp. Ae707_Ps1]
MARLVALSSTICGELSPLTYRRVGTDDEILAELSAMAGYDDGLAGPVVQLALRCVSARPPTL